MLFSNRRVEEELERIRKANLPPAKPEEEVAVIATEETAEDADVNITAKDIFAMIIAAYSIILPYAAIFIGITILFVYLFLR